LPTKALSVEKEQRIRELLAEGMTHAKIAEAVGVGTGTVGNVKNRQPRVQVESKDPEPITHEAIRKLLKGRPHSQEELADALDCGPKRVREAIQEMQARGAMLFEAHGKFDLKDSIHLEPGQIAIASKAGARRFGVTGDNHLCNKHARLDVLNAAYDHFEREGITEVFNTGNWIDGEARFNKTELVTAPGMDNQLDYLIDKFPQRKGITTHYIAGDDHEGWYQQREGVEIGRYLQMRAERQGRHDLNYLGYGECDVRLEHGSGSACMRVVHPGGGSSYAISYTDQKRVESYQGGEKPQIELAGHYHKFNYGFPREVHTVQTGCTCDQTMFMRKKRLQAHVGFLVVNLNQDEQGCVTRFNVEWFPFFDRGFYERRFAA
jgi:biotin operon repressor